MTTFQQVFSLGQRMSLAGSEARGSLYSDVPGGGWGLWGGASLFSEVQCILDDDHMGHHSLNRQTLQKTLPSSNLFGGR